MVHVLKFAPTKSSVHFLSPMSATSRAQFSPLDLITQSLARSARHQAPHYAVSSNLLLVLSKSEYFPQHPVVEYPHAACFLYSYKSSSAPIQNSMQNYSFSYSKLHFLDSPKIHRFYRTLSLTTVFTNVYHWTVP
jgi:hypothetical protein